MGERTQLVVQADDFGMCHAVNSGIERAFTEGVVTQASLMAACPWVTEALALADRHSIPLGLHQTLTCEWDNLRWGPITGGASLTGPDRTFRRTVEAAAAGVDPEEATAELLAQAQRVADAGIGLGYLDIHMGPVSPPAYKAVRDRLGVPFIYPVIEGALEFASIAMLSQRPAGVKKDWLLARIESLGPGVHLIVSHPGEPGPELASLTGSDSSPYPWAEEYRASDLEVLLDPEVRLTIEKRGIELVPVAGADFRA